jgi:hypothetical protein
MTVPNLVSVTIRADDATGPAFASVLARAKAMQAALNDTGTIHLGFDQRGLDSSLMALRAKIQSLGIADIADVNVQPGRIMSQLQLLKRAIQQQGISDLLDVNLNKSQLAAQLASLKGLTETIPVNFDVSSLNVAKTLAAETVPVKFGMPSSVPAVAGQDINERVTLTGAAEATAALKALDDELKSKVPDAAAAGAALGTAGATAYRVGGFFGFLQQHINLFGGALGTVPWVGTVTGLHLLLDSIVEVAAELVPAAIAFGAFAAAAVPAVKSIYTQEQALYTVSQAFNQQMPGLSGNFSKVAAAVQPQVYVLFGEALDTMNRNTGTFMTLATGAGKVLDGLGARAEMALGSNGMSGFAAKAVDDLQVLGNIIGNVFGIFGNMLKIVPGYAEILFHALQDVTGALEAMTGNSIVQGILGIGMAFHGAIVWGGLAASGFVLVGNAALGLVQKFGILKGAELGLFDTAAMGAAFSTMGGGLKLMAGEMVTLGAGEDIAAAGSVTLEGAMAALDAINPLGWIAIGIGAIAALVVAFGSMKTAAQQAYSSVEQQLNAATTFTQANTILAQAISSTNSQLSQVPKYITVTTMGMHGLTSTMTELNPQWQGLASNTSAYSAQQSTLSTRMSELDKVTGSQAATLADLNALNINAGAIATESAASFANQKTQIQALVTATTQLAGYTGGQALAAQNALTNEFVTGTLPAIQKVTQAEDTLIGVVTGGETAFIGFQQGIGTMATDAKAAGAAVGGLSANSLTLSSDFYTAVGSAQKMTDALQQQNISAKDLTTVIATSAGEMLAYAGNNTAARSVVEAFINNALGPGTVSLQNMNTWVGKNSTSLTGMNNIVAESTVKAGTLANVLQNDLNAQFQQALLKSSGASGAIAALADAITHGGTQTQAYQGARAQLIKDLESTGMSAQNATSYVNGLQGKINALSGKNVSVGVTGTGSGGVTVHVGTGPGAGSTAISFNGYAYAAGGIVGGYGSGDTVPAMLTPGEVVVPKAMVAGGAVDHLRGKLPGFASGGLVGNFTPQNWVNRTSAVYGSDVSNVEASDLNTAVNALLKSYIAAQAASVPSTATAGTAGGIIATMMKNMAAARGWTGAQWDALYAVEMAEAGFNMTATNPSSGAYGLAQFINGPSEYAQYGGNSTTAQGQITGMLNYIAQRYGTPEAAWAHESAYHWYDNGGWLMPGLTMAYNGTGKPEPVGAAALGAQVNVSFELGSSGNATFDEFMLTWIREHARIKGGGSVQAAFGR